MKKYTIYTDYHIGHPYFIKPDFEFTENTIFLGDNFDLKNVQKKDLKKYQKKLLKRQ